MQNPLVSILIPFKDTEAYLSECMESILRQAYQNWELLIVDDASVDDSYPIVHAFALKDPRIKLFKNQGSGIIPALRTAFNHCQGDLITRMDSDDIMTPDKIGTMANLLVEHGPGHLAVGQVKYFSHRGISNGYERYETWLNELTEKGNNFNGLYKECAIPSPCWMVYKTDLERCGAFEPDRYPEDYDLTFRFYENGLQGIPCDKVLHHWRDYDTRTSRTSEHYAANYFLDIKLHYFLKLEHDPQKQLVVWGAGNKGKTIAKSLLERKIDFRWVCDNPKKIDKDIYGKRMEHFHILNQIDDFQGIITVANENEQETIKLFLMGLDKKPMMDYFFFC
ncbi:glycosyltransferase [Maribacter polysiphoniae]|uniref:Glycosyltransferase n=1 Tax=Maribacter polysiphoniae TaxID=429344 RepID=A0A316DXL9_9FLAO|nr:glycosyltransferase family 2 protein [Maribacter polysiphoniae]MBD1261718.1 glycosyltransferase [Maribacter polysiphoniae]PWK22476.1 glycosyltransferase involved in cell wall biosynthesis [Maribacter polysiphoniae]